jgi:hypothetical protein
MFNRREVILSSAAMIAGLGKATAASAPARMQGEVPTQNVVDQNMTTAAACTDCTAACSVLTQKCIERVAAGATDFTALHGLSSDCGDLCTVAATLLGRKGPLAPAICQACADACDRLVELCSDFTDSDVDHCKTIVGRCAVACRELITLS